jgi:Ca-activated chloride channel family protein
MSELLNQLTMLLTQLHFLRPLWLLSILPALALAIALWRQPSSGANWRRAIAADLLAHLLAPHSEQRQCWPWLALFGWMLAAVAMAGPAWEKLPQPVLQKRDAVVIVLDLSLSMYAEDIQPSRLQRARFKILDMLKRRDEGLTGLVAYSGDAHVVSPLTDDTATIANLVPALAPDMMPNYGSDPVAGIEQAIQLLHNAGFERGSIVLISDEITDANVDAISARIGAGHWQLSILGVGSEQGAPIPINRERSGNENNGGGFLKQRDGSIVIAQLHRERFEQLARTSKGRYSDLRVDDTDLDILLPAALPAENETRSVQREFDSWRERGAWLIMLLLPIAALTFRRGWLLILLTAPLLMASLSSPGIAQELAKPNPSDNTHSSDWGRKWADLWQRPDQQGQQAFDGGDAKTAAEKFRDPAWKGAALYRAGDYAAAAQTLQSSDSADADYNRGNALAHAGELQEAIKAYDTALTKKPDLTDATANRELVKKLLQQQSQQNQSQKNQDKDNPDKNKDSERKDNQDSQQQSSDQQSADQKAESQANNPQNSPASNQSQQSGPSKNPNNTAQNEQQNAGNQTTSASADDKTKNPANDKQPAAQNSAQQNANNQPPTNTSQTQQAAGQQQAAEKNDNAKNKTGTTQQVTADGEQSKEQQQQQRATEQWLRQIPDDPAGLLRRKFLYEHRQRERSVPRDNQQPLW